MWRKLLCFFNFHKWEPTDGFNGIKYHIAYRKCKYCPELHPDD